LLKHIEYYLESDSEETELVQEADDCLLPELQKRICKHFVSIMLVSILLQITNVITYVFTPVVLSVFFLFVCVWKHVDTRLTSDVQLSFVVNKACTIWYRFCWFTYRKPVQPCFLFWDDIELEWCVYA